MSSTINLKVPWKYVRQALILELISSWLADGQLGRKRQKKFKIGGRSPKRMKWKFTTESHSQEPW